MRSGAVGRPGLRGPDAVVHVAREYESENDHAKAIPTLVEAEIERKNNVPIGNAI